MSREDYPTGRLDTAGLSSRERTKAAYQKYLKGYLRCCRGIDDSVGRELFELKEEVGDTDEQYPELLERLSD